MPHYYTGFSVAVFTLKSNKIKYTLSRQQVHYILFISEVKERGSWSKGITHVTTIHPEGKMNFDWILTKIFLILKSIKCQPHSSSWGSQRITTVSRIRSQGKINVCICHGNSLNSCWDISGGRQVNTVIYRSMSLAWQKQVKPQQET